MGRFVSLRNRVQAVGLTDTGKVREHNEDSISLDGDIGLFVLADGMGGYNAGEVASGIAVKTVVSLVKEAVEHQDMSSADTETGMARPSIFFFTNELDMMSFIERSTYSRRKPFGIVRSCRPLSK